MVEPELFGPYRLDELIGNGGMGEVYRAFDTKRGRVVALKRLRMALCADANFLDRFRHEVAIAAQLEAPHIVPIHDYGDINGRLFLDMRLVTGPDLGKLLAEHGPLSPSRAVAIITQLASALDAAHAQGLVHRDVKPSNVLLTNDGFAYLADFGIARKLAGGTTLTVGGDIVGTPAYIAPERFLRQSSNHRADVYALACVLFESLTGQPPFVAHNLDALMYAHINISPPQASRQQPAVPPALDEVIAQGMAKDPTQRFASAGELARAATAAVNTHHALPLNRAMTIFRPATGMPQPAVGETQHWRVPARVKPDDLPSGGNRRKGLWLTLNAIALALVLAVIAGVLFTVFKPSVDASAYVMLSKSLVTIGDTYVATASGFSPGEEVEFSWAGPTSGTMNHFPADPDGKASSGPINERDPPGDYTITATGMTSRHTASTPLRVVVGSGSETLILSKPIVAIGDSLFATAWGFLPGEKLTFTETGPVGNTLSVVREMGVPTVDSDGKKTYGPLLVVHPPGYYTITVTGQTSHRTAPPAELKIVANPSPTARLVISKSPVVTGEWYFVTAWGFSPGERVTFSWVGPNSGTVNGNFIADSNGICWLRLHWTNNPTPGTYTTTATGETSGRGAKANQQIIRPGS